VCADLRRTQRCPQTERTHSPTRPPAHSLTRSPTQRLTHQQSQQAELAAAASKAPSDLVNSFASTPSGGARATGAAAAFFGASPAPPAAPVGHRAAAIVIDVAGSEAAPPPAYTADGAVQPAAAPRAKTDTTTPPGSSTTPSSSSADNDTLKSSSSLTAVTDANGTAAIGNGTLSKGGIVEKDSDTIVSLRIERDRGATTSIYLIARYSTILMPVSLVLSQAAVISYTCLSLACVARTHTRWSGGPNVYLDFLTSFFWVGIVFSFRLSLFSPFHFFSFLHTAHR
jgi:hypothetical protein